MFLLIWRAFCNFPNLAEFRDTAPLNYLEEMNQHKKQNYPTNLFKQFINKGKEA